MNCENTNKCNTTATIQWGQSDLMYTWIGKNLEYQAEKQQTGSKWPRKKKNENSDETRKQFTFEKFCQHKLKEHIKIRKPEHFQPYISKVAIATAAESWKHLYEINNFCHPVTLAWFSIQILVISKFSKLSWNISLSITGLKSPFNS